MYQLLLKNQSASCRRGQVPFQGISLLAFSLSPLANHGVSLHSHSSPSENQRVHTPYRPMIYFSAWLDHRALSQIPYDLLIAGAWQGLFKGAGLGPCSWQGRWPRRKQHPARNMKALLLLVLPWLSPANYIDNVGNLHFLYSELWVPLSSCLPGLVCWVCLGWGPESVPWMVCLFREVNSTCIICTWTKHPASSLKQCFTACDSTKKAQSYWCGAFLTRHFFSCFYASTAFPQ